MAHSRLNEREIKLLAAGGTRYDEAILDLISNITLFHGSVDTHKLTAVIRKLSLLGPISASGLMNSARGLVKEAFPNLRDGMSWWSSSDLSVGIPVVPFWWFAVCWFVAMLMTGLL